MKKGIYKNCKWCNKEFYQKPYPNKKFVPKFCSMTCRSNFINSEKLFGLV